MLFSFGCCQTAEKSKTPLVATDAAAAAAAPSSQPATKPARQNDWVASPSADLPAGFPAPGPLGQIIIKQYPAYREAIVHAGTPSADADGMFFPLFNHIQRNNIPMSSPVEMSYSATTQPGQKPQSMAFVYPAPTTGTIGPDVKDAAVAVVDIPAMTVVSVAVRGSYNAKHFQTAYAQLQAWLKDHAADYQAAGQPRYLAYNSPFVLPFLRVGEVQIPVRRSAPSTMGSN